LYTNLVERPSGDLNVLPLLDPQLFGRIPSDMLAAEKQGSSVRVLSLDPVSFRVRANGQALLCRAASRMEKYSLSLLIQSFGKYM